MSAPARARGAALALGLSVALTAVGVPAAHAQSSVGGEVPSVLGLSVGEPSPFVRVSGAGRGRSLYTASIAVEVTATEEPTRLSLADGEALAGRRRGHLVRGGAVLRDPLRAAVGGPYRSLDRAVDPVLAQWNEPISDATATIRLRQTARGKPALGDYEKLLLVTLTAAGP